MANNRMALFHASGESIVIAKRMGSGWYAVPEKDLEKYLNRFFDSLEERDDFFDTQDNFVLALEDNRHAPRLASYHLDANEKRVLSPEPLPRSYEATPCTCGYRSCRSWQVRGLAPEAKFTEAQARAVADLLNGMPDE